MESDEHLHARIRLGDIAAFDTLYARYEGPLFGFLVATLRDRAEAEDALHDVFLRALETPPARLEGGGFRAWLFRVAKNGTLNRSRSRTRGAAAAKNIEPPPAAASALDDLVRRELHVALEGAVERLPEALAEVYRLRTSGLSYEEMAEVLEAPVGTVKSRMHEMVKLLREDVEPWIADE